MANGDSFNFGDWHPVREAMTNAYSAMEVTIEGNIPTREWNLVGLALDYHRHATMSACVNCKTPLDHWLVIRCLDCKAPLCEQCAPRHFWPNGRPQKSKDWH